MPIKSLSQSSLRNFEKYSSLLAGNDPYIPFTSSYDLLQTEILTGTQASVTFSSLNSTYGADYQHLQLRVVSKDNFANTVNAVDLTFNSDTGSNYDFHGIGGSGSTVFSYGSINQVDMEPIISSSATNTPNAFAAAVVDILDPFETTKNTTVRVLNGVAASASRIYLNSGLWNDTAAITTITLGAEVSSFITGSRFSLYGLKKASA